MPAQATIFATRTTTRLLDALRDPDNEPVWTQVDARYRPVICGLARRLGLKESDADDVAQHTLTEFVRSYREGRYEREKGRLSSWILGIAHHATIRVLRQRKRDAGSIEDSHVVDDGQLRSYWSDERDRVILARAMGILRDESEVEDRTLLAFELVALRGVPASEAAAQTGLSVEQVYVARSRVTRRLRTLVQEMTDAFEEDA